jgi:hypothetical protein
MYHRLYFLNNFVYIFTRFSLSIGPTAPTQKVFFVTFSLSVNFVVLIRVPGSLWIRILDNRETDPDPEKLYASLRIRIRNTGDKAID